MTTFRKFWENRPRTDFFEFFNDFTRPTDYDTNDWTLTTTEAGGGSATEAIGNEVGGVLVVTNDNFDNDADWFQSTKEVFKFVPGKALEFEARFKVSDATNTDLLFGLQITDTTPMDASDGIWVVKAEDDLTLQAKVVKDSTASTLDLVEMANDTWIKAGFYYDGEGDTVQFFINDRRVGALPLTNAPDDEELAISFGFANGSAAAHVLRVDYLRAVQER